MSEEDDLFAPEYPVSASEDEEDSNAQRKHQRLLDAISSLDGKKRRKLAERTEASLQVSEFGISSEGAGEKISLSDLIEPIQKAGSFSTVKKQLSNINQKKSVELPLSKEETQRIQRAVAYQEASEEVEKWDHVVKQNRKADQLVFPLNEENLKPTPIEEKISGWTARTPLEQEIFSILQKNKQPLTDPLLTPVEEASFKAMSLEEAKLRRAELQKARALQSFYEAKARREKKIKSKKFHKVLKKSKQKEALKEFEELRKSNPEAALEELQKLEKTRMEERMSLKHQNSGKWAKSKAIMAKYDDDARKAMQEQLQKNKELTRKIEVLSESEESEEEDIIPDFVNDAQVNLEGPNPWMTGKLSSETKDIAKDTEDKMQSEIEEDNQVNATQEDGEPEEELSEDEALLKEFEDKRRERREQSKDSEPGDPPVLDQEKVVAEADENGEEQVSEFNQLFQKLLEQNKNQKRKKKKSGGKANKQNEPVTEAEEINDEGPLLVERLERKQDLEEFSALAGEEWESEQQSSLTVSAKNDLQNVAPQPDKKKETKKPEIIDHNKILPVKAKRIQIPFLPTTVDDEEDEEHQEDQKMIIKEAFAGDDVVNDFLKEKRSAEQAGKPKDINLVLPGWGEWGGTNLKVSKKKKRRFIIKAPPGPPRKDQRLPNVIINEKRNLMAAAHQVNQLPFPFNNRHHFESSIRAPVGSTWNTQKAFQKLTSPRIITKQGHIIEPITSDAFQKHTSTKKPAVEMDKHQRNDSFQKSNGKRKKASS
ncbi:UTP14A, small subunit processome component L homeolog [Xenopus laevis]|uniref:LOC398529 protein n=1 Tax=Xenopus laevis TaxID=8355 RepID=Q6NTY7_XENLA|nr:UTP14A, small subunit processome component L homeolog [Xenopus laevis]AAH68815.1 LOC398529 protein [Xenopus laevis]